ncbi:hypothetical protein HAX54_011761, partial [Datura stramonium]|nr:hypothetical protein [Datura stramonium]
ATGGSNKTGATGTRSRSGTRPGVRRPSSPCYSRRKVPYLSVLQQARNSLFMCIGMCDAVPLRRIGRGDTTSLVQRPKMDLLLQLGKGTPSPNSNSSRNKENINLLL